MDEPYRYNIEFSIEKIDIYNVVGVENADDYDKLIQFQMRNPDMALTITEEELIDAINCGKDKSKHKMFCMTDSQLNADKSAQIVAKVVLAADKHVEIGRYEIEQFESCFKDLRRRYNKKNDKMPTDLEKSELAPFKGVNGKLCGSVVYRVHLMCFGPLARGEDCESLFRDGSLRFLSKESNRARSNCNEYFAEVNGNALIIRVNKDSPYQVRQEGGSDDKLTIRGCNQQIDFKFPNNFTCCQCRKSFGLCACSESKLTEYQRQTSTAGRSFTNTFALPVIRGTLKYPGRFDNQSIAFNVREKTEEASNRRRVHADLPRSVALQVDGSGESKKGLTKDIEMCRLCCDDDSDIFVLKIGKKGTTRDGKSHEIEVEMRTPRLRCIEKRKTETREVQVIEREFEKVVEVPKEPIEVEEKPKVATKKPVKNTLLKNAPKRAPPVKRK